VTVRGRKKPVVCSPGGILPGLIYETVRRGGAECYAIRRAESLTYESFLDVGAVMYSPPAPCPWPAPTAVEPYGKPDDLFEEVREYVYDHLDLSDEREYTIVTCWILANWHIERFQTAPYIHLHGPPSSGKTRGLDVLHMLGFRALLSPSVSPSAIYRTIEAYRPTFLLDEAEVYGQETKREILGILNAGYRRGQFVIRTDKRREGAPELSTFDVFGFKALAGVSELPRTLAGRAIRLAMSRATRPVRRLIDQEKAQLLRNKLLAWRFDHVLDEPPLKLNPIDVPDGRVIELFTPLTVVAELVSPGVEKEVVGYAEDMFTTLIEEERTTREAEVFEIILAYLDVKAPKDRLLALADIANRYNQDRSKAEQMSVFAIGRICTRLGFKKRRREDRRTCIELDEHLIERLRYRYRYTKEPSQAKTS